MSTPVNAADLRPWIFWIVIGVVALVLVVCAVVVEPTHRATASELKIGSGVPGLRGPDHPTAEQLKKAADARWSVFQDLSRRSKSSPAQRSFNFESPDDVASLRNDFVMPTAWAGPLRDHVRRYDLQIDNIAEAFDRRSRFLDMPVSTAKAKSDWYKGYVQAAGAIIAPAVRAQVLPATIDLRLKAGAGSPHEAFGFISDPDSYGSADDENRFFQGESALRSRQLRIIQLLLEEIATTTGQVAENPIASKANEVGVGRSSVALTGLVFQWPSQTGTADGQALPMSPDSPMLSERHHSRYYPVTFTMRGTLSAVSAVLAALEGNAANDRPIVVVAGFDLGRQPYTVPGGRRELAAEAVAAQVRIAVLDFSRKSAAPTEAPQ